MGSVERGYSSHRRGMATRVCDLALFEGSNRSLSNGVLNAAVRQGGWQAVTGVKTLLRTYAAPSIDKSLDSFRLSFGRIPSVAEKSERLQSYVGPELGFGEQSVWATNLDSVPLILRALAWETPQWKDHSTKLDQAVLAISLVAEEDTEIMPVRNFVEPRLAFNTALEKYAGTVAVRNYIGLCRARRTLWLKTLSEVIKCFNVEYEDRCRRLTCFKERAYETVADLEIGNVTRHGIKTTQKSDWTQVYFKH